MNWKIALKIVFSFVMLGLLIHAVHIKTILPYFKNIRFFDFAIAILWITFASLLGAWRWSCIMTTLGAPWLPVFYFKTHFKGILFNQVLPSSIGGDGYRILETTKLQLSRRLAITGVLADRVIGFSGLVTIAVACLYFAHHVFPAHLFMIVTILVAGCVCAIIGITLLHYLRHPFTEKIGRWLYHLSETLNNAVRSPLDGLFKLGLSIGTNLSTALSFYFLARALNIDAHVMQFLIIIPYVLLIIMIPISMAGWGLREGAMIALGGVIGLPHGGALAISLLGGLVLILNSLPGLYFYCTHHVSADTLQQKKSSIS